MAYKSFTDEEKKKHNIFLIVLMRKNISNIYILMRENDGFLKEFYISNRLDVERIKSENIAIFIKKGLLFNLAQGKMGPSFDRVQERFFDP